MEGHSWTNILLVGTRQQEASGFSTAPSGRAMLNTDLTPAGAPPGPRWCGLRLCRIRTCVASSGERHGPCSWVPVSVQTSSTPKPCQAVSRTVLQAMGDVRGESETQSFSPSSFSKCFPTTLCQGLCWGVWDTSEDKTQQHGLVELIFWHEQIANKQHT